MLILLNILYLFDFIVFFVAKQATGYPLSISPLFKVHRGFPGKAALIFRKKYSESRNP